MFPASNISFTIFIGVRGRRYGNPSIQNFSPRKQPSVQSLLWLLSTHQGTASSVAGVALGTGVIDGIEAIASEQTTVDINRLLAFTFMTLSY